MKYNAPTWFTLAFVSIVIGIVYSNDMCRVNPEDRRECGWSGISKAMCQARGCCFNDKYGGMKWCYVPETRKPGPCSVNPEDRKECGYAGISRQLCVTSPHCCFNNKYRGVKWCYFKA